MVSKIIIPSLGATGGDVTIEQWLVKIGDRVEAGAPIVTVSTDKANVDIEAFRGGFVRELLVGNGTSVPVGEAIALITDSMEEAIEDGGPVTRTLVRASDAGNGKSSAAPTHHARAESPCHEATGSAVGSRILASPLARRVARTHGVDLNRVKGSGRRGAIHRDDVMKVLKSDGAKSTTGNRTPLSPMRRAIAQRTSRSKSEIPHFYLTIRIDMTAAQSAREQAVALAERNGWSKPSVTDLALAAAARALVRVPQINVSFDGDAVARFDEVHIGVVIGLEEGMIIPVVRHADQLDVLKLADTTRRLKEKAGAGALSATELTGATFTVSNLGMYGVDNFIAVISPPEAAILALGAIRPEVALVNGAVVEKPILTATLSADHRAVDGVTAAKFLAAFKDVLEHPIELFVSSVNHQQT